MKKIQRWNDISEIEKKNTYFINTKDLVNLSLNSKAKDGFEFYKIYKKKK